MDNRITEHILQIDIVRNTILSREFHVLSDNF